MADEDEIEHEDFEPPIAAPNFLSGQKLPTHESDEEEQPSALEKALTKAFQPMLEKTLTLPLKAIGSALPAEAGGAITQASSALAPVFAKATVRMLKNPTNYENIANQMSGEIDHISDRPADFKGAFANWGEEKGMALAGIGRGSDRPTSRPGATDLGTPTAPPVRTMAPPPINQRPNMTVMKALKEKQNEGGRQREMPMPGLTPKG